MDIPSGLLPANLLWGGTLVYAVLLAAALRSAPRAKIRDNEASHVFFASVAVVACVWTLRAGIQPGLNYHLLGVTALTLMFDWQFALLAVSMVLAITTWQGPAGMEAFGVNVLVMGALPVLATRLLLAASRRWLPANFFIYIFINSFLAGALAMLLCGLAAQQIHALSAATTGNDYLLYIPMLMFGEAFLNGMTMTLLVAYKPRWVATFHDRWYLEGK
jgi:uncharacterized membrane protein